MGRAQQKLIAGREDLVAAGNHSYCEPALSLGRDVVGIFELVLQHLPGKRQLFRGLKLF